MVSTRTLSVIIRALWITVFIVFLNWFWYWVCYDIFVWNKVLSQVNPQNLFGLIASVLLIIFGTQLGKIGAFKKLSLPKRQMVQRKRIKTKPERVKHILKVKQAEPREQVKQIQPIRKEQKEIPKDSTVPPGCQFYLGYLNKRPKSSEIPERCLECGYVVDCLAPSHAMKERASNP